MQHFTIFVPGWNVEKWVCHALCSALNQSYPNFNVVFCDDASTDDTPAIVHRLKTFHRERERLSIITNGHNMKMPWNLRYMRTTELPANSPEDIIFILDADDFLPHQDVLSDLAQYFDNDPELWMTYGSYDRWPDPTYMPNPAEDYPQEVKDNCSFRAFRKPCFNHPLVFKRFLWDHITDDDLKNDAGEWNRGGYDWLIMMPMLELANNGHWKWLPDILYTYNEDNPFSDSRVNVAACELPHQEVAHRPPRTPL